MTALPKANEWARSPDRRLPPSSVRGRMRLFIERFAATLGDDVLEIGTRMSDSKAWWIPNRDLAKGKWLSIDTQPGLNVDQVLGIEDLPGPYGRRFTGVICSNLTQLKRPWLAFPNIFMSMQPGGSLIVSTLLCYPIQGQLNDHFRLTAAGLSVLLEDAGFIDIKTECAGTVPIAFNDHGEPGMTRKDAPMQVFAYARKPPF